MTRRERSSKEPAHVAVLKDALKNNERMVAIIHHARHWSFTVIDTRKRALQIYDPTDATHVEANIKLKESRAAKGSQWVWQGANFQ